MLVILYLILLYLSLFQFVLTANTMYKVYSFILFSLLLFLSFFIFRVELITYFCMIIYMGAIMVLFLFVIMLIEFKPLKYYSFKVQLFNVSLVFFTFFIFISYFKYSNQDSIMNFNIVIENNPLRSEKYDLYDFSETVEVGIVLYEYFFYFIIILTNIFLLGILSVVLITKNKNKLIKQSKKRYKLYF